MIACHYYVGVMCHAMLLWQSIRQMDPCMLVTGFKLPILDSTLTKLIHITSHITQILVYGIVGPFVAQPHWRRAKPGQQMECTQGGGPSDKGYLQCTCTIMFGASHRLHTLHTNTAAHRRTGKLQYRYVANTLCY
jgi:hypothetical protein